MRVKIQPLKCLTEASIFQKKSSKKISKMSRLLKLWTHCSNRNKTHPSFLSCFAGFHEHQISQTCGRKNSKIDFEKFSETSPNNTTVSTNLCSITWNPVIEEIGSISFKSLQKRSNMSKNSKSSNISQISEFMSMVYYTCFLIYRISCRVKNFSSQVRFRTLLAELG